MTLQTLNTLPAREVFDLHDCPEPVRAAFHPREEFGEASLLTQPRISAECDVEFEEVRDALGLARIFVLGLAFELIAFVAVGLYVWGKGLY